MFKKLASFFNTNKSRRTELNKASEAVKTEAKQIAPGAKLSRDLKRETKKFFRYSGSKSYVKVPAIQSDERPVLKYGA